MKGVYIFLLGIIVLLTRKVSTHLGGFYDFIVLGEVIILTALIVLSIRERIIQYRKDELTKKMIHPFDPDLVSCSWHGIGSDDKDEDKNICILLGNKMLKFSLNYFFIFVKISKFKPLEFENKVNQQKTIKFKWFLGLKTQKKYQL